jgi:hypothetical protein
MPIPSLAGVERILRACKYGKYAVLDRPVTVIEHTRHEGHPGFAYFRGITARQPINLVGTCAELTRAVRARNPALIEVEGLAPRWFTRPEDEHYFLLAFPSSTTPRTDTRREDPHAWAAARDAYVVDPSLGHVGPLAQSGYTVRALDPLPRTFHRDYLIRHGDHFVIGEDAGDLVTASYDDEGLHVITHGTGQWRYPWDVAYRGMRSPGMRDVTRTLAAHTERRKPEPIRLRRR